MTTNDILNTEADLAADYIEELLDIADLDGDIEMSIKNDRAIIELVAKDDKKIQDLIGENGEGLLALQELARLSVNEQLEGYSNLLLDINNWREKRVAELVELAKTTAEEALETKEPVALGTMNSFERKTIHDAIKDTGAFSHSEGAGKDRHIVVTAEEVTEDSTTENSSNEE
jgi:spoIIIJ-associated protein